ncbi:MAG: serine hydrolase domain-containing protein [Acidiferrobacterales bacterium]
MTGSTYRFSFFLIVALAMLTGCAQTPVQPENPGRGDYHYLQQYLSWYIPQQMKRYGVPGVSIAVVDNQRLVWAKGFGYADRERRIPAGAETVYQVGSISKLFTATAVMQLVGQGKINLDAPIQNYIPRFSMKSRWNNPAPITPRELLSHHAGLPTYYLKGFFSPEPLADLVTDLRGEYLAYPPGQVFNYSNLGPDLMGLVMERITGQHFSPYMQQALLEPLGMHHSSFTMDNDIAPLLARGYVDNQPTDPVPIRDIPAGSLLSNVVDLSRFMRLVFGDGEFDGHRLIGADALASMFQPQFPNSPLDFGQRFGLGWMLSGIPVHGGGMVAWHNGGTKAFLSQMAIMPEKKLGVVVLANADTANKMIYDIAEQALRLALKARYGISQPPAAKPAAVVKVPRTVLDQYVGEYSLMGTLAHVTVSADHLELRVAGHTLELVPTSPTMFRAEFSLLGMFSVPIDFPPVEFVHVQGHDFALLHDRMVTAAEKIPHYTLSKVWRERTGSYHIINPDAHYLVNLDHCRMLVQDGRLLLDLEISGLEDRRVKIVIMPVSDSEAYVFGLGRNVGDMTTFSDNNGRPQVHYSGYIFERDTPLQSAGVSAARH